MRRHFLQTLGRAILIAASPGTAALAHAPTQAAQRIGVLILHGKSPASSKDSDLTRAAQRLEQSGMLVRLPDLPWSRGRFLDGSWDQALADIGGHVQTLRSQGAIHIVLMGHGLGVPAAVSFATRGGDVQALVLMAPAHLPKLLYNDPIHSVVRDSVDKARAMVANGQGDVPENFGDLLQGKRTKVATTARNFLSYFDPASDAELSLTAHHVPPLVPVFLAVGHQDPYSSTAKAHLFDKLPANPKNRYLKVRANHQTTPRAALEEAIDWIKTTVVA